jgi:hypothetical protein
VVGATGLVTVRIIAARSLLLGFHGAFPWRLVVAYGVLAHVAYSLGWVVESVIQK